MERTGACTKGHAANRVTAPRAISPLSLESRARLRAAPAHCGTRFIYGRRRGTARVPPIRRAHTLDELLAHVHAVEPAIFKFADTAVPRHGRPSCAPRSTASSCRYASNRARGAAARPTAPTFASGATRAARCTQALAQATRSPSSSGCRPAARAGACRASTRVPSGWPLADPRAPAHSPRSTASSRTSARVSRRATRRAAASGLLHLVTRIDHAPPMRRVRPP